MMQYIENPKDATRKLLELINEFCKVAGYKINKPIAFLYTNNETSEREIKETIPFTIKKNRIPRDKPTEGGNRPLHSEICKMLIKEIEDDTNRWKMYCLLGLEESILLK